MVAIEAVQTVPLKQWADGTIRITGTRVTLDSVLYHFKQGDSPEEIANKFPAAPLVDVYAVITYYLSHRDELEAYLKQQEAEEDAVVKKLEADPQYQSDRKAFRELILKRWAERQKNAA